MKKSSTPSHGAIISGRDIIFISSIEWNFLWQVHQEIALRLAGAGNRVLYIENTGIRAPGLKDTGRIAKRIWHWANNLFSRGIREVLPNVFVCSPLMLPPFGSRWQQHINRYVLSPLVHRTARRLRFRDPIVWTYLPTDNALELIQSMKTTRSVAVYYCVADFALLTRNVGELRQSENQILKLSDVVFTNCSALAHRCEQSNDNVHVFAPGVDLKAFSKASGGGHTVVRNDAVTGPVSLTELPRPVIGYIGGMHKYVNFVMLEEMAQKRPEWSWVFVGPLQTTPGKLADLANVYLIGQRPHDELVNYVREFDVCMVPYVINAETATVVPVKLNEYLAVGKPVVSTDLPTVRDFDREHDIVFIAEDKPESFLQSIEHALSVKEDEGIGARRRAVAALADWDKRLSRMSSLIEHQLRTK